MAKQSAVNPFNISIQNLEWHSINCKNYLNLVFLTFSALAVQPQFDTLLALLLLRGQHSHSPQSCPLDSGLSLVF
jgi:hypothetical protein